jgi:hypothetical protein
VSERFANHVWHYDFVEDRTHNGRRYRMLNIIDEFTRECLAIRVSRKPKSVDVIDVLSDLFILRGIPGHIRSDNGPEFVAKAVREWIAAVGTRTAYIEPGSPWETDTAADQGRFKAWSRRQPGRCRRSGFCGWHIALYRTADYRPRREILRVRKLERCVVAIRDVAICEIIHLVARG